VTGTEGLRRALLIVSDKITEVFEQQNIHKEAVPTLNFDKAKDATMAPDTLLVKSPMGTGKTKVLGISEQQPSARGCQDYYN